MKLLLCLFFVVYAGLSQAQNPAVFTKKAIDKKYDLKGDVAYVINGILYQPHEKTRIDSALGAYPGEHLIEASKVRGMNGYKNHEVMLMTFAYRQSPAQLSSLLETVKARFRDQHPAASPQSPLKDPVLWINNEQIHFTRAKKELDKLHPGVVYFIDYKKEPLPAYGALGKNGLVRIWTKQP